jgi:hypothetical protein
MKEKTKEALGIGMGGVVGSGTYQANHVGLADLDLVRAIVTGMFVGLIWLLIPLRLSRKNDRESSNHE